MDYRKLNVATVTDAFPLPFIDGVLNAVAGHEVYSFLDGFRGYNQIWMHPADPTGNVVRTRSPPNSQLIAVTARAMEEKDVCR